MISVEPVLCLPTRSLEEKLIQVMKNTQVTILKRNLASRGMCVMLHYVTGYFVFSVFFAYFTVTASHAVTCIIQL